MDRFKKKLINLIFGKRLIRIRMRILIDLARWYLILRRKFRMFLLLCLGIRVVRRLKWRKLIFHLRWVENRVWKLAKIRSGIPKKVRTVSVREIKTSRRYLFNNSVILLKLNLLNLQLKILINLTFFKRKTSWSIQESLLFQRNLKLSR